jgi:HK97 family phage prohead protease
MNQDLQQEFGARLVTLSTGATGLRGAIQCEVKMIGEDEAEFIASTNQIDRYNEVIDQAGWDFTHYKMNPVVVDSHRYDSISAIVGRSASFEVRNDRLVNRVKFATDNPLGELARKMTKGGFIKSESVGFIPKEWQRGAGKDQPDRTFTKSELLEISLVAVPANPGATIGAALKSGAIERSDVRAVVESLKEFCSQAGIETIPGAPGPDANERALQTLRSLRDILKR